MPSVITTYCPSCEKSSEVKHARAKPYAEECTECGAPLPIEGDANPMLITGRLTCCGHKAQFITSERQWLEIRGREAVNQSGKGGSHIRQWGDVAL